MSLEHFASFYDVLMEDAPYDKWIEYTKKHVKAESRVLDVACGTGTLTLLLEREGFQTFGVDISEEMLAAAEKKVRDRQMNTQFFQQDMREMGGFEELDAVTLYCDGLNYLADEKEIYSSFHKISKSLRSGGVFLFDIHSIVKMTHVFNDQLYGENAPDISYLWFCEPGEEPHSVHHALTFFVKQENGSYERKDEELYQRTFSPAVYERLLKESGFDQIEVTSDFGNEEADSQADRLFFKAVKK